MVTTLSLTKRPADKYRIELVGFKRIDLYADEVITPNGVKKPEPGDTILPSFHIEKTPQPKTFLHHTIDEEVIRFIALYHKLDPIPRKRTLIITTLRRDDKLIDEFEALASEIIPGEYYVRKHRGRKAVFITAPAIINEIKQTLGDRYSKKYPTWLIGHKYEKIFVQERLRSVVIPRKNAVETTSSSVNNEVLIQMLINQGFYLNIRNIEHSSARSRTLWYITLYPITKEGAKFLSEQSGKEIPVRTKNIINGKGYYTVKSVHRL